jgi:hypothetical protein
VPCHMCFRIVTVAQAARSVSRRKDASRHIRRRVQTRLILVSPAPAVCMLYIYIYIYMDSAHVGPTTKE